MNQFFEKLRSNRGIELNDNMVCRPRFFRLNDESSRQEFQVFLEENASVHVSDEIYSQLTELLKLRYPKKKFSTEELNELIRDHTGGIDLLEYGQWVYYPWLNKVSHILPKEEFVEVRTNRNQYKITPKEEELLATKKIGIIGLSVGKAIALTIALERICGELVLADFDVIELSNLNRIQTGVQNMGLKKTVIVAREIAEIDPYLKVTCMHDGLTEENVSDFFTQGKKLDVCVEVCDGLTTKIFARQKAKELGVPVVMNSSDRGTTDIERFDLEPGLPILHGLIDHLDLSKVKQAKTNEEKVPYLLPMLGVETSSERLKASMLEIQETITTWPQLASGVVFGGGICTDVCRRILLGQFTKSGRYFVDPEKEINDDVEDNDPTKVHEVKTAHRLVENQDVDLTKIMSFVDRQVDQSHSNASALKKEEVEALVEAGVRAPSAGNAQPWKWLYKKGSLFLIHDKVRGSSVLNYKNTVSLVGLGASAENILLKANEMGYEVVMRKFPIKDSPEVYAVFKFYKENISGAQKKDDYGLVKAIPYRITNRKKGARKDLRMDDAAYLKEIAQQVPGAKLKLFSDPIILNKLKEIIAEIDWIIMTNKSSHSQFMSELRWSPKEVQKTKDGLDIETLDITPTEKAGLLVARDWSVTKYIKKWGLGKEFGNMSRNAIDACSALGLITVKEGYPNAYFDGGRAVQKVWLGATQKGVSFQPMSLSTFLSERIADNNFTNFEEFKDRISDLFQQMKLIFEIKDSETDVLLFRLSYADEPEVKPLRRNIEDVMIYEGE